MWPVNCPVIKAFPFILPLHLSFPSTSLHPSSNLILFPLSPVDSIHSYPDVFLEGEQTPGGSVSQPSSETEPDGGGREGGGEGGRRASVTSVESEASVYSMGRLGSTIANSE